MSRKKNQKGQPAPPQRQPAQQPVMYSSMPPVGRGQVYMQQPMQQMRGHPQQQMYHPGYQQQQQYAHTQVAKVANPRMTGQKSVKKKRKKEEEDFGMDMSDVGHYKFENNIATRHIANKNKNCICRVEQYLNLQTNFAPPESLMRLDSMFRGMLKRLKVVNADHVEGKIDLLSLFKTNMFNGPKRVRVDLKNSSFRGTFGSLHYYHGSIEMESKISISIKKLNEKPYPLFKGTGTVYLEPWVAAQHFLFVQLNGVMNVDKEIFEACEGSLKFETVWIKGLATKLWGKEGLTEHRFEGRGWVLLRLPCPPSEVQVLKLNRQRPTVVCDGNYVILRKGANVKFSLKRMGKGLGKLISKMTHGEGILNEYTLTDPNDTGEVWICPTWRQRDESVLGDFVNIGVDKARNAASRAVRNAAGDKNVGRYQRTMKFL